jgi:hypothetical protein
MLVGLIIELPSASYSENDFIRALSKAIDDVFLGLGPGAKDTIYYYVEKNFQLKPQRFYDRVESFHKALEGIFGEGVRVVENSIADKLYSGFGLNFEKHENWTLSNYVDDAKKHLKLREDQD